MEFKEYKCEETLSAGICDNCQCIKLIATADETSDHEYYDLYCDKKKIFIEPQNEEDQVKECDEFKEK